MRVVAEEEGRCKALFKIIRIRFSFLLQICDFGLAKWKQQAATQTTTGRRCGAIAHMAPEAFKDPGVPRTVKYDVYSFGILLWELLTEKKPFENGSDIVCLFAGIFLIYCVTCKWICVSCVAKSYTYLLR